jgi:hypothetical protein
MSANQGRLSMKVTLSTVAAAVAVAALALLAAAPSTASAPGSIRIDLNGVVTWPDSFQGTFVASGVVNDSGTYAGTYRFAGRTIHVVKTLIGTNGTITLKSEAVVVPTSPTTISFKGGSWATVSGTGAYADLHAIGTPAAASGASVDLVTGVIRETHEGQGFLRP